MNKNILFSREFLVGMLFLFFALFIIVQSSAYRYGTLEKMGPAFFPTMLGVGLLIVALLTLVRAFNTEHEPVEIRSPRALLMIFLAVFVTGWTIGHLGAVLSLPILLGISILAGRSQSFTWGRLVYFAALVGGALLLFVVGLDLPIPLFGTAFK